MLVPATVITTKVTTTKYHNHSRQHSHTENFRNQLANASQNDSATYHTLPTAPTKKIGMPGILINSYSSSTRRTMKRSWRSRSRSPVPPTRCEPPSHESSSQQVLSSDRIQTNSRIPNPGATFVVDPSMNCSPYSSRSASTPRPTTGADRRCNIHQKQLAHPSNEEWGQFVDIHADDSHEFRRLHSLEFPGSLPAALVGSGTPPAAASIWYSEAI